MIPHILDGSFTFASLITSQHVIKKKLLTVALGQFYASMKRLINIYVTRAAFRGFEGKSFYGHTCGRRSAVELTLIEWKVEKIEIFARM